MTTIQRRFVRAAALALGASFLLLGRAAAQSALAAMGSPPDPRVPVSWDRYYDHAAIGDIGRRLQKAYPDRCHLGSIGTSHEGREIWLLTVTNFKVGNVDDKPGMYIDGNIHANEVQGSIVSLYTAWYLCEMADRVPWVDSLLDARVFYIVPTINPDGHEDFLKKPNTPHSPRSGAVPRDSDGDGLVDEDAYDDLDGDGNITQMRRRNPNGRWIPSPVDPRIMIRAEPDQPGEYDLLGDEGYDNDGDGLVNEDGIAYSYDPNRNWPWNWQPRYVQGGADYYPGSLPETRAVLQFIIGHPNIAGVQTYHNSGGWILRGPGVQSDEYQAQDIGVYDAIGKVGETILPGYKYVVIWSGLYTTWGNELDWTYAGRGIISYSNELWTPFKYFEKTPERDKYDRPEYQFDRLLLMREAVVPWTPVNHPQYGMIEVGGVKKQYTRAIPGFLLPAEAHRNMAFTVYQASQMPLVTVDSVSTRPLGGGLTEVTAIVANKRLTPTHTRQDVLRHITRPDWVTLDGGAVIAGFVVEDPLSGRAQEQERNPQRIEVDNIPGMGTATVRWVVRGKGPFTVTVDSQKGGTASRP